MVQGQGARGEFPLNGKNPGLHSTLLFELKPTHLTDCHSKLGRDGTGVILSPLLYKVKPNHLHQSIWKFCQGLNSHG